MNLLTNAYACGKKITELKMPLDVKVLEIHRGTLVMSAENNAELVLQSGDVVVLRGKIDELDPCENYLLQG